MNQQSLSRRKFLKLAAMTAAGTVLAACAPITAEPTSTSVPTAVPSVMPAFTVAATLAPTAVPTQTLPTGRKLKFWWWGETEAPGLGKYLQESIDLYQKSTGNSINPTLENLDTVIPAFQTASAANNAPDLQYMWNGIYHMESVWLGDVEPLNGLIPDDKLKNTGATQLSIYQGKQYRVGWYAASILWLYNKDMFDKAGLNADQPPTTFDELLNVCDKLKAKGFTPIVSGNKDGNFGEFYLEGALTPNLDTPADALNLFAGELDWREPRYYDFWSKLAQLWKAGYINDDLNSINVYPGIDMFGAGKGAMTTLVVPLIAHEAGMLGAEKIGTMVWPASGVGKLNGVPIKDAQGIGISSQSQNKEVAANFLEFMHSTERVNALWSEVKALPTDLDWNGDQQIQDPLFKNVWKKWVANPDATTYMGDLMPTLFWTDAMFVNAQKIISGEYTGEQAGNNAYAVTQKWREQNPDELEKYKIWAKDLTF